MSTVGMRGSVGGLYLGDVLGNVHHLGLLRGNPAGWPMMDDASQFLAHVSRSGR